MKWYSWDKATDKIDVLESRSVAMDAWYQTASNRTVAKTKIDGFLISTVFLTIDHSFGGNVPILFETMIFDHADRKCSYIDLYCRRYATAKEAREGHQQIEMLVRRFLLKAPQVSRRNFQGILCQL